MQTSNPHEQNVLQKAVEALATCEKMRTHADKMYSEALQIKRDAMDIYEEALKKSRQTRNRNIAVLIIAGITWVYLIMHG